MRDTVTQKLGNFTRAEVCLPCDWYQLPVFVNGNPTAQYGVCPSCGGDLTNRRGRYRYKLKKSFLFGDTKTYLAFEVMKEEPKPPTGRIVKDSSITL